MKTKPKIEIDLGQVKELAGRGLSIAEIASCLGISPRTVLYRQVESAEFAQAIKDGRAEAKQTIANALFKAAEEGNITAAIWLEKTRFGYHEINKHEMSGPEGKPIEVKNELPVSDAAEVLGILATSVGKEPESSNGHHPKTDKVHSP